MRHPPGARTDGSYPASRPGAAPDRAVRPGGAISVQRADRTSNGIGPSGGVRRAVGSAPRFARSGPPRLVPGAGPPTRNAVPRTGTERLSLMGIHVPADHGLAGPVAAGQLMLLVPQSFHRI